MEHSWYKRGGPTRRGQLRRHFAMDMSLAFAATLAAEGRDQITAANVAKRAEDTKYAGPVTEQRRQQHGSNMGQLIDKHAGGTSNSNHQNFKKREKREMSNAYS